MAGHQLVRIATATPTLSAPGAYSTGDYVGTTGTPMSFPNVVRGNGFQNGILQSVVIVDKAAQSGTLELWLFSGSITTPTDNAAWAISDADALLCVATFSLTVTRLSSNNGVYITSGQTFPFALPTGTTLYGALVTRGSPTYASGDLQVTIGVVAE